MSWPVLFGGFVVTGIYYVATSLIFPDDPDEWRDLDEFFEKHRRKVVLGIWLCNVVLVVTIVALAGMPKFDLRTIVITWSFFPVALGAAFAKSRRITLACLAWLIFLYPLSAVWM